MESVIKVTDLESFKPEHWVEHWTNGTTPWHKVDVNPWLQKHIELLERGRRNLRIFVPLCGKSLDIKWLADRQHTVIGADVSSLALESFFKENSLEFTVKTHNGITYLQDISGHIKLYSCNIYDFGKTGEDSFDIVWDRGSFGAINPEDRPRYVEVLSGAKTPDCRHLIEVYEYDDTFNKGFPYSVSMSTVTKIFGEGYNVESIVSIDAPDIAQKLCDMATSVKRNLFLVTRK